MGRAIFWVIVAVLLLIAVAAVFAGALIGGGGGSRSGDLAFGPRTELTALKGQADANLEKLIDVLPGCLEQEGRQLTKDEVRLQLMKAIEEKGEQAFLLSTTGGDVEVNPRGGWGTILTELLAGDALKAGVVKQCAINQGFDAGLPPPQLIIDEIRKAVADTGYLGSGYLFEQNTATAEQLNEFIQRKVVNRDSVMIGIGEDILAVSHEYKINPLYIMAHAGHESAWGTSRIAKNKNNLFGYGAFDRDPYGSAHSYPSVREGLRVVIGTIKKDYLTPSGKSYHGETLEAMNINYATDRGWAEKIKRIMVEFNRHVGRRPNV